jgi:hypothetical protein
VQNGIEQLGTNGVRSEYFYVRLALPPMPPGPPVAPDAMAGPTTKRVWYYCSTLSPGRP